MERYGLSRRHARRLACRRYRLWRNRKFRQQGQIERNPEDSDRKRDGVTMAKIEKSDREWRKLLSDEQYRVLREHGTERPGSSPLNAEQREGEYSCAGCGKKLFE